MKKPLILAACLSLPLVLQAAWAETASELLEKGIYYEESVGDLDAAIKVYEKIAKDADNQKAYVAEALYRQGTSYKILGDKDKASRALNRLVSRYPGQAAFVAKAKQLLGELSASALALNEVPWEDGESLVYDISGAGGAPIGQESYVVRSTEIGGKDAWEILTSSVNMGNNSQTNSRLLLSKDTFLPINGNVDSTQLNRINYVFDDSTLVITPIEENAEPKQVSLKSTTYELVQLFYMLRRLNINENFSLSVPLFDSFTSQIFQAKVTTLGKKKITVAAGTFDSWELSLELTDGNLVARKYALAISDDHERRIVRLSTDAASANLNTAAVKSEDQKQTIKNETLKLSFDIPGASEVIDIRKFDPSMAAFYHVRGYESLSSAMFAVKKAPKDMLKNIGIEDIVDGDIKLIRDYFGRYELRKDSREKLSVSDFPAQRYVADFQFQGKDMVEYRIYIKGSEHVYWFILRCWKDDFDQVKKDFEAMYSSLEV